MSVQVWAPISVILHLCDRESEKNDLNAIILGNVFLEDFFHKSYFFILVTTVI